MVPGPDLVQRFARDLDALIAPGARLGMAVSGGPDSLALLLLATAARPGQIEAATVDHGLRDGARAEAQAVAELCAKLQVPHAILTADWKEKPSTAIQERARAERYRLLAAWAGERNLDGVATGHQLEDQAETMLMRLSRGSGVRGLAAMRGATTMPGSQVPLLRPLLGWSRSELAEIIASAKLAPARDPSNDDERFERVRLRRALAQADWLDPRAIASSAGHLSEAEAALEWAVEQHWRSAVTNGGAEILYASGDAPAEIRRRVVARAVEQLATEGGGAALKGSDLDRLLETLVGGGVATMRGVRCSAGARWRFTRAPARGR